MSEEKATAFQARRSLTLTTAFITYELRNGRRVMIESA